MTVFGRILPFSVVEDYVLELAEKWFTTYLAEVERQVGDPARTYPPLADWGWANEYDKFPEEHLPFLLVTYSGLSDQPSKEGDGSYNMRILMGASIVVSASSRTFTRRASHIYGAAFKAMILQHRSLEHPDDISGVTWVDERPAPLPSDAERSLIAMNMFFYVDVKNVVSERGAPLDPVTPPADPYVPPPDPPVVEPVDPDPENPDPVPTPRGGISIHITKEIQP